MKSFIQLKKNLKEDFSELRQVNVAILGDSATQFLTEAIRGLGYEHNLNINVWEADFNQIERQVFDLSSELYSKRPEIVIVFRSTHKLLSKYNKSKNADLTLFAEQEIAEIESIYSNIDSELGAKVIYFNHNEIDDSVFGNYSSKVASSFLFQLRKLNFNLMELAEKSAGLFLLDLSSIQNKLGKDKVFSPSMYVNTDMVLGLDVLPHVAYHVVSIVDSIVGKFKKCIILDLDNTTWGGIIGDDGLENIQIGNLGIGKAFSELQQWVKKLKNRGIIVAVCSKNTESIAKEPFEKHPEMVLRLEDISVFMANWDNKADNIRQIQSVLNIGFDSMVFLDDNPFERNIVRENIPEVTVPEMPEDPAYYLEFLYGLNLFETVSYSNQDKDRTKLYQVEAERVKSFKKFTNEEDFLKNLEMESTIAPFNKFNTPRVAQLTQRSNQFNLRTKRYTEADVERIGQSDDYATFTFTLEDKFGDNGLICIVVLEKKSSDELFIDTWLMSCRVLKRGMESFVLNTLVSYAKHHGFKLLTGEYIATPKNMMVEDHYPNLGFTSKEDLFHLDIEQFKEKTSYIINKELTV